jgi:bacteriocin-like protein
MQDFTMPKTKNENSDSEENTLSEEELKKVTGGVKVTDQIKSGLTKTQDKKFHGSDFNAFHGSDFNEKH